MCVSSRQLDPRTRSIARIANLCLVAGLILWVFVRPSIAPPRPWIDGVCGLLLGFYITVNLVIFRRAGSCRSGTDLPPTQN